MMICEEIFDETSHPSVDEIKDYATKIGIDPDSEPNLLPLAAEGLMKALPPGWRPCYDEKSKSYYYLNKLSGKTQWEHPLDEVYRGLVVKKRAESQSLSLGEPTEDATYNRDDIPSYEEPPPNIIKAPSPALLGARKKDLKLSAFSTSKTSIISNANLNLNSNSNSNDLSDKPSPKLSKQKSEDLPSTARKVGLSMFNSFDESPIFDKHPRSMTKKSEFMLSGGGTKFLKSNTKKEDEGVKKLASTPDFPLQPRSILRERTTNIETSRSMDFDKNFGEKSEDDDKKSVRFNLDLNPDIFFDISDKSLSEEDKQFKEIDDIIKVNLQPPKKSRFIVSPVPDSFTKGGLNDDDEEEEEVEDGEKKINQDNPSLKLIKPNPTDFIKPKLKVSSSLDISEILHSSESDDESIVKNAEKKVKNLLQKFEKRTSGESLAETFDAVLTREAKTEIIEQAEKQFEAFRTSIWEQKSKELEEFKEKVQESHKKEMERILITEKTKYEEAIKAELENLRKEMENRSAGTLKEEKQKLEDELETNKDSLEERYKEDKLKRHKELTEKYETLLKEMEEDFEQKTQLLEAEFKEKLELKKAEFEANHDAVIEQLKENHTVIIEELKREFTVEEQQLRKEHKNNMEKLKSENCAEGGNGNGGKDSEPSEHSFEKLRCEKRLLEDKYRCLKEKYLRLKSDVKNSIEKRCRRRDQSVTTTGSETDMSYSIKKEKSPLNSPLLQKKPPLTPKHSANIVKPNKAIDTTKKQIIIQDLDTSVSEVSYMGEDKFIKDDSSEGNNVNPGRSRKKLFSRLKSSSTSRIMSGGKPRKNAQRSCSPVENLRRQLQKLEDLEDQLPENPQADPYHLRYPFTDSQKFEGSSELEFFRHRIHLERDSIKRAKESLRSQKTMFQQRQKELKLKHGSMARHTLQQLCQEEKDLTDMEVSLHRSRSLLGEKVIRLRHLEQSLQRATVTSDQNKDDATLSDISSHSASSGISSTEFATADNFVKACIRGEHLQESSEIIQSLENLNSEIQEIWEVLRKQQQQGNMQSVLPPLPFVYPDLGWPLLAGSAPVPAPPSIPTLADRLHNYRQHVALANAQSTVVTHATQGATTTLVERTRNLRHWLRQAGIDPSNEGNSPQATL